MSGSRDKTIKIWDATTLQEVGTLEGHTNYVYSVAVFPDGSKIVSGSGDKTIKIWDATTFYLLFRSWLTKAITTTCFAICPKLVKSLCFQMERLSLYGQTLTSK